jgi:hypothetical protein
MVKTLFYYGFFFSRKNGLYPLKKKEKRLQLVSIFKNGKHLLARKEVFKILDGLDKGILHFYKVE